MKENKNNSDEIMHEDINKEEFEEVELEDTAYGNHVKMVMKFVGIVALAVLAAYLVKTFVAEPFLIKERSMVPTFNPNDYIIVNKLKYNNQEPQRGDIVVFRSPTENSEFLIKRIIALPHEWVEGTPEGVKLYNEASPAGELMEESYVTHSSSDEYFVKLRENEYFVLGDNRPDSEDSRTWGPLHKDSITGYVSVRLLPVKDIQRF